MNKLFLLDAYALIYRAYYAFIRSPRINSKGENTSAVYGFVSTLEELLRKEQPTHIGVAFDPAGPTFRHEAYPDYKAQREATPEDIRRSVPIIKRILQAYDIPVIEVPGFEADDVIGTLAHAAAGAGMETYMVTPDKDYGQLVGPNVWMYRPGKGGSDFEILGPAEVTAKYGIEHPRQVIDLLGLMGDAADNIPGCPGVGEKTAVRLIAQFGSIEALLARTDELKGALRKKVEENREKITFSKFLATIVTDAPVSLDTDKLLRREPDTEALRKIFEELEFRNFISRICNNAPAAPKQVPMQRDLFSVFPDDQPEEEKKSNLQTIKDLPIDYQLVDTEEKRTALRDFLLTKDIISLDTETTSTDAIRARLVGMSFSVAENQAFYVPTGNDREQATRIVELFRPVFENPRSLKVGQNLKYDLIVLGSYGIELAGPLFDTMIAHYVLQPELRHNMDYLAEIYLHYQTIHIDELIGPKGRNQRNMADLDPADICHYACEDADVTLKLKNRLEKELEAAGATALFNDIEMPLMPVLAHMEQNGVYIDTEALAETSRLFTGRMNKLEEEIFGMAGETFNLSSPRQVGEVLFDRMRLNEKARKTKSGQYVTSEEELEKLRAKHPIVEKILAHRGLKKLISTYLAALPQLINPETGRIHTSFNQTVTATGRLSSSNPNLQNIPVRGDDGKEIRKAFIPEPGCLYFSADYSQIELRLMAHLSADPHMLAAFAEGDDIHAATAAKIYHKPLEDVTRDERRKAKTANFGIIYGISAFGLAERMGVSRTEAKELIDNYFATYPGIRAFMEESKEKARQKGYIETLLGRRRYLADILSKNATVRGYAERNAINAPIQGSAADIIKIAMIRIFRRFKAEGIRSKMILQVHDELNFSVIPEERERVRQIVIEEMEGAYPLSVPLKADYGWGDNWLEAH